MDYRFIRIIDGEYGHMPCVNWCFKFGVQVRCPWSRCGSDCHRQSFTTAVPLRYPT